MLKTESMTSTLAKQKNHFGKVLFSSMIGNALEWYDFMLYGYCSVMISALFFPSSDPFISLLKTYGVFFAGFVMRPLGGALFGYLGDKIGRKQALSWSIYCMAIPTALIGALPTYEVIGWMAPVMLTILRLFQGLSMGGEFTGSIVFIVEHAPAGRKGFWGSWATLSCALGSMMGVGVCVILGSILTEKEMYAFGWRIPFLISVLGSFVGAYMRKKLDDTEDFKKSVSTPQDNKVLWSSLFEKYWSSLKSVFYIDALVAVGFFIICLFVVNYLQNSVGFSYFSANWVSVTGTFALSAAILLGGHFSDIWGAKKVMLRALVCMIMFAVPCFYGLSSGSWLMAAVCQIGLSSILGFYFGSMPAALVRLFPPKIRCLGIALAHNFTMTVLGGTAPYVATFAMQKTQIYAGQSFSLVVPGVYLCLTAALSFFGILKIKNMNPHAID
jgi:MHS family proline/betaine transporter-like MFS transporter